VGKIVGGFIMPHDPLVFVNPRKQDRDHILAAYEEIRRRVVALEATSAVIVGADHYILFNPKCLPPILIGLGEINGPIDQLPGVANRPIAHNEELARRIFDYSQDHGFDLAVAKGLAVDHAIGTPAQLCLPADGSVKTVPVYMASGVAPYVRTRRAYQFGQMVKAAVEGWDSDERVVVMGSGGISHWVGTGEMGKINPDFDRFVLDAIVAGDPDPLLALSDEEILRQGGNGAMEIRHFLAAMGALPGGRGEVIAYSAWPGGVTGLGFAEIRAAA
jgi:protocatechuate 4,5-dioxygenase beta chain